jgi:hypothetical protein
MTIVEWPMRGTDDPKEFEATVRRAFARLTGEDLPRAAAARGWPVRTPEEFRRLLLDHLRDGPGAEPRAPAPAHPCLVDLILAVEIGERLLAGNLCCATMNRHVRCETASGDPRRAAALKALQEILARPADRPKLAN